MGKMHCGIYIYRQIKFNEILDLKKKNFGFSFVHLGIFSFLTHF